MSDDVRQQIVAALVQIAPEADLSLVDGGDSLRDELDLDSMDFLRFVQVLYRRTGIEVPEIDYPQLDSLDGAEAYLRGRGVGG